MGDVRGLLEVGGAGHVRGLLEMGGMGYVRGLLEVGGVGSWITLLGFLICILMLLS